MGPTSSNKLEIEENMGVFSEVGIKMHLGKGKISQKTIGILKEKNAVYAIMAPVTALLESKTKSRQVVAFPELGMEAMHRLIVEDFPVIIASAKGTSVY